MTFNPIQLMTQINGLPPGAERDSVAQTGVVGHISLKELMETFPFIDQIGSKENKKRQLIQLHQEADKAKNLKVIEEVRKRLDQIS